MKSINNTRLSIILAIFLWLMDSVAHHLLFNETEYEFIPHDLNELWMRIIIVALIICFGIYTDYHSKKILLAEQEKRKIFVATVSASQHILNNLLNHMQYFKIKMDESDSFGEETTRLFNESLTDAKDLVLKLSAVEELTEDTIKDSVYPK